MYFLAVALMFGIYVGRHSPLYLFARPARATSFQVTQSAANAVLRFAEIDGIVSMISEGAHTTLDDLDYDAMYRVDAKASLDFARSCLGILGNRLPARTDTFWK